MIRPVVIVAQCLFVLALCGLNVFAAGPKIDIVTCEKPPALELTAGVELTALLKRLYSAEVQLHTAVPAASENLILLGSSTTNPAIAKLGDAWPKLSMQGHALKSVKVGDKTVLVVGGGSPVATLWAVYELGYQGGVRSLLFGDIDPAEPIPFTVEGFDKVLQPAHLVRGWETIGSSALGAAGWGVADQKPLIKQLAKLKFNLLVLNINPEQPFIDFGESAKSPLVLASGFPFRVAGDTAGRSAFGGLKQFENPDFAGKSSAVDRLQAGRNYIQGVILSANAAGLKVSLTLTAKKDFLLGSAGAKIAAAEKIWPELVAVDIKTPEATTTFPLPNGNRPVFEGASSATRLKLGTDPVGTLPQADPVSLWESVTAIAKVDSQGLIVQAVNPGDIEPLMHFLSRAGFDATMTPDRANKLLIDAACGPGTIDPVKKALDRLQKATAGIKTDDPDWNAPRPDYLFKEYHSGKPAPKWWADVQNDYLEAMNEMYRANSRSREEGRPLTLYFCRRLEFGYEYFNMLTALRNAGIARDKKDTETQITELEKAVDAFNGGLNAMAAVSRTPSDRAVIAVMNAYGYHPLKAELEKLENAR